MLLTCPHSFKKKTKINNVSKYKLHYWIICNFARICLFSSFFFNLNLQTAIIINWFLCLCLHPGLLPTHTIISPALYFNKKTEQNRREDNLQKGFYFTSSCYRYSFVREKKKKRQMQKHRKDRYCKRSNFTLYNLSISFF